MLTIWKESIPITDSFGIALPKDAKTLSVQPQGGQVCIWFLCDPQNVKLLRQFRIFGTGHPIEELEGFRFVGTFQLPVGLVFHLFERDWPHPSRRED